MCPNQFGFLVVKSKNHDQKNDSLATNINHCVNDDDGSRSNIINTEQNNYNDTTNKIKSSFNGISSSPNNLTINVLKDEDAKLSNENNNYESSKTSVNISNIIQKQNDDISNFSTHFASIDLITKEHETNKNQKQPRLF